MRRRERENLKKGYYIYYIYIFFYNNWFLIEILVIIECECEFNVYSFVFFQRSRLTSTIMQQLVSSQNCDVIWTGLTGVPAVWSMWWRNSVFLHALLSCYASVQWATMLRF